MATKRLGIVGCGLTGAVTAMLIKQRLPQISVMMLEKSRGTGGRMCTSRSSMGHSVDLGAQFITRTTDSTPILESCYEDLLKEKLLIPLQQNVEGLKTTPSTVCHYVTPKGSNSLVKHFLKKADCEILFDTRVYVIHCLINKWLLECTNGLDYSCDAVVLTMPVPQILKMEGLYPYFQGHLESLKAVEYCPRFSVGLYFNETDTDFFTTFPHCAKFFSEDPVIRYYAIDHRKKNSNAPPSIVIHTTKEFAESYLSKKAIIIQNLILDHFMDLVPGLPKPAEIKFHKWKYSQVEKIFQGKRSLCISEKLLLFCGGDSFTSSTFEGCILSAESIVNNICDVLHK